MAEIKHGAVTVTLEEHLTLPAEAGNLSLEVIRRLPKARQGVGLACAGAARSIENLGGERLHLPPHLSAEALRLAGQRAEEIDAIIKDMEIILHQLRQANLLFDAEATTLLGQLNDQVKAQGKQHPELEQIFAGVRDYFSRSSS